MEPFVEGFCQWDDNFCYKFENVEKHIKPNNVIWLC